MAEKKMTPVRLWAKALASGQFRKIRNKLTGGGKQYCVMGLAARLARQSGVKVGKTDGKMATVPVLKWLGITPNEQIKLIGMNDRGDGIGRPIPFKKFAEIVEENFGDRKGDRSLETEKVP